MRFGNMLSIVRGSISFAALALLCLPQAQPLDEAGWSLPQALSIKDAGPRTYQFTIDYTSANSTGAIFRRQRFVAEYTRGLPEGQVVWNNVTEATSEGETAPFGAAQKRDFMEGFRYRDDMETTLRPNFFKGFPPAAIMERNLIWDTAMIEMFGQNFFDHLKLNEPYHAISNQDTDVPGVGKFQNRDVVLEWVGRSKRNGEDCALIEYRAFFNPLEVASGGMSMKGRSDYWGQIWVSLGTKQIEYATLYETVVAEMKLPGQDAPQLVNIFRNGSLAPYKR